ncbi:hypothetical protein J5N97_025844 [Dioscorea zingiberensis]|uniref:Pentatricopeptide repeat-containing protein n=1 Tax=Dioscorea zingiberensis TaxID=325984 RepID=A0A9D5C1B6_9LILI|nr:hypothetical protein J5N97_025844 [Dioscorea zingiberensis]
MRHHGFRRRLLAIASHYQLGALRRLATSYSGRIVRADPAGLSLAVEVDPPDLTTDARGYDLPRRDLICRVSKILLSSSPTSDPLLELSDYLQTLKITLSSLEVSEILKSLRSPSKALDFFRYVAALPGFRHDCFTYNRILSILSKSGAEMDLVQKIIDEMERNGVRGSISTVNILIGMVGAAEIERCLSLQRSGISDSMAYLRYRDVEGAAKLYQVMRRKGHKLDIFAYNMLLDALAKADKIDEAYTVFRDMKRKHCEPDVYTYTILVRMAGKIGKTDEFLSYFDEMLTKGCNVNLIAYNTMDSSTCKEPDGGYGNICIPSGLTDKALELFEEMENSECKPDVITYNSLINCLGKSGDLDEAHMRFKEMQEKGLNPDVVTYSTLIECFGKSNKVDMACRLFDDMLAAGCYPNIVTYNILLDCLEKYGRTAEAFKLYDTLRQQGLTPDSITYAVLERLESGSHVTVRVRKPSHVTGWVVSPLSNNADCHGMKG